MGMLGEYEVWVGEEYVMGVAGCDVVVVCLFVACGRQAIHI